MKKAKTNATKKLYHCFIAFWWTHYTNSGDCNSHLTMWKVDFQYIVNPNCYSKGVSAVKFYTKSQIPHCTVINLVWCWSKHSVGIYFSLQGCFREQEREIEREPLSISWIAAIELHVLAHLKHKPCAAMQNKQTNKPTPWRQLHNCLSNVIMQRFVYTLRLTTLCSTNMVWTHASYDTVYVFPNIQCIWQ